MNRELILGELQPDVVCAIALGFLENHRVTVTLESVTLLDPRLRTGRTQSGWLRGDDPLQAATREYLTARREALLHAPGVSRPGWVGATAVRARDGANDRAVRARNRAWHLLEQRGTLLKARRAGEVYAELD